MTKKSDPKDNGKAPDRSRPPDRLPTKFLEKRTLAFQIATSTDPPKGCKAMSYGMKKKDAS
jgi:hypothetical protein